VSSTLTGSDAPGEITVPRVAAHGPARSVRAVRKHEGAAEIECAAATVVDR
jgi:hypothetical protein